MRVGEIFGKVFGHETWVGEAVKVIMDKVTIIMGEGVRFRNSEARAGDGLLDVETFG